MTTQVLRYRCDLCGKVWLTDFRAGICEFACAEEVAQGIAARSDETRSGSAEGKSPVAEPCAQPQSDNRR